MANVGLCVLSSKVKKENLNLREIFERLIVNEPSLQNRFRSATKDSKLMGWGLPLGSVKRPFSCDHVMLTGDAASLIDPFTGEGIGNAMLSGLLAANAVEKSLANNNFSAAQLFKTYDSEIERSIRDAIENSSPYGIVLYWRKFFDFKKISFYTKLIVGVIPALILGF